MMTKKTWIVLIVILLAGCTNFMGKESLYEGIKMLEQPINDENWEEAKRKNEELINLYEELKWKLQLIGDEEEYEELYNCIVRLAVAIEEKDKMAAKLEIASIYAILKSMYSL